MRKTNAKNLQFTLSNLHCSSCVHTIETALNSEMGISQAQVNFADKSLSVTIIGDASSVQTKLAQLGYDSVARGEDNAKQQRFITLKSGFAIAACLPFLINMVYPFIPGLSQPHGFISNLGLGLLSFSVLSYSGNHYFRGAWHAFWSHAASMDSLIALGTGTAWVYSMLVLFFSHQLPSNMTHLYFESAVLIIAFISIGQSLEERARQHTSDAIKSLLKLKPKTARVIKSGEEIEVTISAVNVSDIIRIKPGEQIPVDGVLIEGDSQLDESMLTGEPKPIKKQLGSKLQTGTLNISGSFLMRATEVGENTALARIITLVKQAQSSKPAIGKIVDKIAGIFVPLILIISIITALIWYNLGPTPTISYMFVTAMTVLVIACPCALGLGVPISVTVGIGIAARHGILIRNSDALQTTGKLEHILLDKTGTITQGKPSVINIIPFSGFNEEQVLELATSLEALSEHPLAHAIVTAATKREITPLKTERFQNIEGFGVRAIINQRWVIIGKHLFMEKNHIDFSAHSEEIKRIEARGDTLLFIAYDNKPIGLLAINDPIKPDSKQAIMRLKNLGIKVTLLTGDNQHTAKKIAASVGIDEVYAQLLPHEKLYKIQQSIDCNRMTAMVGDGINDAPALAKAHIGFAIGSGTDVALESADIVLMHSSLMGVADAVTLSKATMRNIHQNLFGAFFYNLAAIPVAAGILYPLNQTLLNPAIAGAAMAASSITVVLNANRLRFLEGLFKLSE